MKNPSKIDYANAIGVILRMTPEETNSLNKAGVKPLQKIFEALANSKPIN